MMMLKNIRIFNKWLVGLSLLMCIPPRDTTAKRNYNMIHMFSFYPARDTHREINASVINLDGLQRAQVISKVWIFISRRLPLAIQRIILCSGCSSAEAIH